MERTRKNENLQTLWIGLKLLLICAIVAGVVSFVYALTADAYAQNEQRAKEQAIGNIFALTEVPPVEKLSMDGIEEIVYKVKAADGSVLGYCVEAVGKGFGGDIKLMVGYNAKCELLGVEVVTHAETPGLGAKIVNAEFLNQFAGKADQLTLAKDGSGDIDAIAGATISSRAVTDAVNKASDSLQRVLSEKDGGAIR